MHICVSKFTETLMKLFSALALKFEKSDWALNPEFGLIDTLLEQHPELLLIVKEDIMGKEKASNFGRGDVPSAEQICVQQFIKR